MKILLIEDERKLADALGRGLVKRGFETDVLYDGAEGERRLLVHGGDYALAVVDLMLPGCTGKDICRNARLRGLTLPILMLTAQSSVETKVDLLNVGADDYVVKPFSFDELVARIHALLRRPIGTVQEILAVGELVLDPIDRVAKRDGVVLDLTQKEFAVLEYLMRRPGEVVRRDELLDRLWDFNYDAFSNVVDVHVKNLRKKLNEENRQSIVEAVRGVGYRLRA